MRSHSKHSLTSADLGAENVVSTPCDLEPRQPAAVSSVDDHGNVCLGGAYRLPSGQKDAR